MVDIFAEAERMAREEADRQDAFDASPAGQALKAKRIADDIRRGLRDQDGVLVGFDGDIIHDDEDADE